jgi:hypothetical protein
VCPQSNPGHGDGEIGITLNCDWAEPLTDTDADVQAAERYVSSSPIISDITR